FCEFNVQLVSIYYFTNVLTSFQLLPLTPRPPCLPVNKLCSQARLNCPSTRAVPPCRILPGCLQLPPVSAAVVLRAGPSALTGLHYAESKTAAYAARTEEIHYNR